MKRRLAPFLVIVMFVIAIAMVVFVSCVERDNLYETYDNSSIIQMYNKGYGFLNEGKADSALIYYTLSAEKYREDMPDSMKTLCSAALNNAGYIYFFFKNDYVSSYETLLKALDISETLGDSTNLPAIYLNIGNIYLNYKDTAAMMDNHRKALRLAAATGDTAVLVNTATTLMANAITYNSIGSISEELRTFDSMRRGFQRCKGNHEGAGSGGFP